MSRAERAVLKRTGVIAAAAAVAVLSAIGVAAAATVARSAAGTSVSTHQTSRGKVLAAGNGHTLYLFTHDSGTTSRCYGSCAKTWVPMLTTGHAAVAKDSGLNAKLAGTTRRTGGQLQVTFNGHPLYTYARDVKPGQINGEGAKAFLGRWYIVSTSGNAIKPKSHPVCDPLCPGY